MGSGGGAWAAQMQSPCGGCLEAVLPHWPRCKEHSTVRGPPLQTRVVAAYGAVSQLVNMLVFVHKRHDDPGAHGMKQGQTKHKEANERGKTT